MVVGVVVVAMALAPGAANMVAEQDLLTVKLAVTVLYALYGVLVRLFQIMLHKYILQNLRSQIVIKHHNQ